MGGANRMLPGVPRRRRNDPLFDFRHSRPPGGEGWVSATMNGSLRFDGISVRRTADGRLALSFPARRDTTGKQHPYLRPLDDATRRDIEHQIFAALGLGEHATP